MTYDSNREARERNTQEYDEVFDEMMKYLYDDDREIIYSRVGSEEHEEYLKKLDILENRSLILARASGHGEERANNFVPHYQQVFNLLKDGSKLSHQQIMEKLNLNLNKEQFRSLIQRTQRNCNVKVSYELAEEKLYFIDNTQTEVQECPQEQPNTNVTVNEDSQNLVTTLNT